MFYSKFDQNSCILHEKKYELHYDNLGEVHFAVSSPQ